LRISQFSIDKSHDAIFWLNKEGKFIYVNEQACNSLGYSKEELLKLYLWDIDPVYPRELWLREWDSYQPGNQGGGKSIETLHKRKDGKVFHVEALTTHTWFGDFELHVAHVRDITERKSNEEMLKLSRFIIDSAADAIYWIEPDAKIIDINTTACKILGYTREELLQMSLYDIDPFFTEKHWNEVWPEIKSKGSYKIEVVHRTKEGKLIPVEIIANYIKYGDKELDCAFARDITDRKKAELELTKTKNYISNIINSMPSLLIGVDVENNITLWNNKAEIETGINSINAIGKNLYDIFPNFLVKKETIKKAINEKNV